MVILMNVRSPDELGTTELQICLRRYCDLLTPPLLTQATSFFHAKQEVFSL